MLRYVLGRFWQSLVLLLIVSFIGFTVLSLAPGGPLSQFALSPGMTQEQLDKIATQMGLNRPLPVPMRHGHPFAADACAQAIGVVEHGGPERMHRPVEVVDVDVRCVLEHQQRQRDRGPAGVRLDVVTAGQAVGLHDVGDALRQPTFAARIAQRSIELHGRSPRCLPGLR